MVANATGGPTIVWGQNPPEAPNYPPDEYNNEAAPSFFYAGTALLDPRWGYRAYGGMPHVLGFQGSTFIPTINAIPSTASTNAIAAAQAPVANTALTLATQSVTGLTVLSSALTVYPSQTVIPSGTLAIQSAPGQITFNANAQTLSGSAGGVQLYDPTKSIARAVEIVTNAAESTGSYKISGFDLYGYPMTQTLTGTTGGSGATLVSTKAFKFISSVIPTGGINSTSVTVGYADTIGFPMRADGAGDVDINFNSTWITAGTGFTAAVTSTATSTTGDVRGTYALQTASNGVNVLQVFQTPRAANISSATGLFGVTQA
jgi:hypothetical protein